MRAGVRIAADATERRRAGEGAGQRAAAISQPD
jgi:hypothetical protein